jgi:sterol desaturase/sphingolipid hydroxylase (fatty acid hydroxylase superfamily)
MHHTDLDIDVTTGARFHPLEILLSLFIKFGIIAVIGAPAVAVLLFEVLLNAGSMFNHANLKLPIWLDRLLRTCIVTPDMHRIHHSTRPTETNSNYGFNLAWWDRLFGTWTPEPLAGHEQMRIGLAGLQDPGELRIARMLALPFVAANGQSSESDR